MTYQFTFCPFFLVIDFVDFDKKPSLPTEKERYSVVYSR